MSSRNGRRHRKKTDDDPSFKPPSQSPKKQTAAIQEALVTVDITDDKEEVKKAEVQIQNNDIIPPTKETENGKIEETTNGNGIEKDIQIELEKETNTLEKELEPLVVDSEEQELQFDDNSDLDSHKGSPILSNRCVTRRSQTRNIPTPKTPKTVNEQNGDEQEQSAEHKEQNGEEKNISEHELVKNTNDIDQEQKADEGKCTPVFNQHAETPPPTEENSTIDGVKPLENDFNEEVNFNLSVDSCESALSTKVNIGSDVTREIDLTLPEENSFLNTAKDLSVIESLRRMSSRRAIRPTNTDYRKTLLKSQAEKHEYVLQQQRASMERISNKRKTRSKTPENPKRFKTESSPGFFSYISSPFSMIRNKFSSSEAVSASTPKLTGYREQETMEDPELSKIEDSKVPIDKKRCTIM